MSFFNAPSYTLDELNKEYRKLAKSLHPDISKEDDAEEKFKAMVAEYASVKASLTTQRIDYENIDIHAIGRELAEALTEVLTPIPMIHAELSIQGNDVIVTLQTGRFKRVKLVCETIEMVASNLRGTAHVRIVSKSDSYPARYIFSAGHNYILTKGRDASIAYTTGALTPKEGTGTWLYMSNRKWAYAYNKRTQETFTYEGKLNDLKKTLY